MRVLPNITANNAGAMLMHLKRWPTFWSEQKRYVLIQSINSPWYELLPGYSSDDLSNASMLASELSVSSRVQYYALDTATLLDRSKGVYDPTTWVLPS